MLEGVQQRIGAHEAQIDAQQREEICVHDVREGVQAAGPLVSTHTFTYDHVYMYLRLDIFFIVSVRYIDLLRSINGRVGNEKKF